MPAGLMLSFPELLVTLGPLEKEKLLDHGPVELDLHQFLQNLPLSLPPSAALSLTLLVGWVTFLLVSVSQASRSGKIIK